MPNNEVQIKITGDSSKLSSAIGDAEGKLSGFGSHIGGVFAGIAKAAAVGGLAIAAGLIGGGVALYKIGESFDETFDKIRTTTGATGDQLAALEQDTKNVFSSTPAKIGDVGTAISDLNVKLGLHGADLDKAAQQQLNLARITKTDLAGNIDASAKAFQKWGISAGDTSKYTDELFRASQLTGVSVGDLATSLSTAGVPLREFGLSFEQSTALIGGFTKAGVNTDAAIAGLKKGLATVAKSGEDPQHALERVSLAIKNAGSDADANKAAIALFGAKAGPEMAAAIRNGSVSIDELAEKIKNGSDTIGSASADTADFSEKWQVFRNKITTALQPLAEKVFGAVGKAMDWVGTRVQPLIDWFGRLAGSIGDRGTTIGSVIGHVVDWVSNSLVPAFKDAVGWVQDHWSQISDVFGSVFDVIKTAISGVVDGIRSVIGYLENNRGALIVTAGAIGGVLVAAFVAWAISASSAAIATIAAVAPLIAIAAAIGAAVAGIIYAYNHFQTFHNIVDAVGRFFRDKLWPILKQVFGWLKDNVPVILEAIGRWFKDHILPAVEAVGRFFKNDFLPAAQAVFGWLRDNVPPILETIGRFFRYKVAPAAEAVGRFFRDVLLPAAQDAFGWLRDNVPPILDTIGSVISSTFEVIKTIFTTAFDFIRSTVETFIGIVQTGWSIFGDTIKTAISDAWELIKGVFSAAFDIITGIWDTFKGLFTGDWGAAWNGVKEVLSGVWDLIKSLVSGALDGIKATLGLAWDGIKAVASTAWNAVKGTISDVWEGIKSKVSTVVGDVVTFVTGLPGKLVSGLASLWGDLDSLFFRAFDNVRSTVATIIGDVINGVGSIPGKIGGFVGQVLSSAASIGSNLIEGIGNGVTGAISTLADVGIRVGKAIVNKIIDWVNKFQIHLHLSIPLLGDIGFDWGGFGLAHLAKGGLADHPMLAVIGDNVGAAHDPEIVTPQSTMRSTFEEVMARSPQKLGSDGPSITNHYSISVTGAVVDAYGTGEVIVKSIQAFERSAGPGWRESQANR